MTESVQFSGPFSASSGYGHDLGGMAIDVDGLVQVAVREESMLDLWSNHPQSLVRRTPRYARHVGAFDKTHLCWSTEEGTVGQPFIAQRGLVQHVG